MSRNLAITLVSMGIFAGFVAGWFVAQRHRRNSVLTIPANPSDVQESAPDCDRAPDNDWQTVRLYTYMPAQTLYNVEWQFCSEDFTSLRIRVTNANFSTTFFQYRDDQILRIENLDLLGDH